MRSIVPAGVVVAESVGVGDAVGALHPEEARLVAGAVELRRRDFTAGRACARRALAQLGAGLGLGEKPVLAGPSREPLWPPGVAGSITHCHGYCAAAVGWAREIGSIGIDAELHVPLDRGVAELVCTPAELRWIAGAPHGVRWETVVFSAKESVYKAWFPVTGRGLDFLDVELDVELGIEPVTGEFAVDLGPRLGLVRGRYTIWHGYVLTSAQLVAEPHRGLTSLDCAARSENEK